MSGMTKPFTLFRGDCIDVMHGMADNSVDAVVTDPPYGLSQHSTSDIVQCLTAWLAGKEYRPNKNGFMGRSWDAFVPSPKVWIEVFRVLKPGGHVLAFAGTRTQDLMCMSLRLAGFEIRDMIGWVYGSGFPKNMDVSKQLDSHSSKQWNGWGTALKPALEPITVARKPLVGTVAENVLTHGTGAINIDGCRVPSGLDHAEKCASVVGLASPRNINTFGMDGRPRKDSYNEAGRFPANIIHDGSDEVMVLFPDSKGSGGSVPNVTVTGYGGGIGTGRSEYHGGERMKVESGSGSAARFFYCAKASRADRNEGLSSSSMPAVGTGATVRECEDADWSKRNGNHHPTVKTTELMAYLCRLVTPTGGIVLDPFMGSGSTGKAAILEGFQFVGIDMDCDDDGNPLGYLDIASARCMHAWRQHQQETIQKDLFAGDAA